MENFTEKAIDNAYTEDENNNNNNNKSSKVVLNSSFLVFLSRSTRSFSYQPVVPTIEQENRGLLVTWYIYIYMCLYGDLQIHMCTAIYIHARIAARIYGNEIDLA